MKTILITGATSGFGLGLTKILLEKGYTVIATGRLLSDRPEIFAAERIKFGSRLIEWNLDVSSTTDRANVVHLLSGRLLDVLINNAGYGVFGPIEECRESEMRKQFEVNFFGVFLMIQSLLPFLRQTKGHIVNVSSVLGCMGFPLSAAYCASKFAVEGLSESLAYELTRHGVDVTLIEPGGYHTGFGPSVAWTDRQGLTSYTEQIQAYKNFRQKLIERKNAPDPKVVMNGIAQIIENRIKKQQRPALAYSFGKDAKFSFLMRKIFPRNLFFRLSKIALRRLL